MDMINWNHYNGALLPAVVPECELPLSEKAVADIVKEKKVLFARWTSDFDCGYQTEWWYCIKDTPISLEILNSKQRYRVKRGLSNTNIIKLPTTEIDDYIDDLFRLAVDSFKEYPRKYRPNIKFDEFKTELLKQNTSSDLWIALDKKTSSLAGYSICNKSGNMVYLSTVKVSPLFINNDVNAALAYTIVDYYLNEQRVKYICDGERNIRHETNYQTFLIKTLGFRFAYCKLNIVYNPFVNVVIKSTFPFYHVVKLLSSRNKMFYNLYCLLKQEKIRRTFK